MEPIPTIPNLSDGVSLGTFARVAVVGTSGSGKTTLARTLAGLLGSTHFELDALHWKPNWVERPTEELAANARNAVRGERWVTDGNYGKIRDIVWGRATVVIWLNYPFPVVFRRVLWRTIRRIALREELYSGNRERFVTSFFTRDSILLWSITSHKPLRARYRELFDRPQFSHLTMIEFRHPDETRRFLRAVRATVAGGGDGLAL
jgi:adenylate kinase family enzyme